MSVKPTIALMYHEIGLPGRLPCHSEPGYLRYVVSKQEFHQQMRHLKNGGHRGVSTGDFLKQPDPAGIVLTFDDGCETDLLEAAPLLRELSFNATFYITLGFLGNRGYLTRAQVRELSELGFEIGSHSLTHPYLPDLTTEELRKEIDQSKDELEQITGRNVEQFSCPGGRWDERVRNLAKEAGYLSVATSIPAANSVDADRFSLGRVAVLRGTNLRTFTKLASGSTLWKLRLADSFRSRIRSTLGNSFYDRVRGILLTAKNP